MKRYKCPGLVGGAWLAGNFATIRPEIVCANQMGWWQRWFFGYCNSCLKEKDKRGIEPGKW